MIGDIIIFITFIGICMVAAYRMGWRHAVAQMKSNQRKEKDHVIEN